MSHAPTPNDPGHPERTPRPWRSVLVVATLALVAAGALVGSALFFTAGLVMLPILFVATWVYVVTTRGAGEPRLPEETPRVQGSLKHGPPPMDADSEGDRRRSRRSPTGALRSRRRSTP